MSRETDFIRELNMQFALLGKLSQRNPIYEIEKGTGRKIRRSLSHVIQVECMATMDRIEEFLKESV